MRRQKKRMIPPRALLPVMVFALLLPLAARFAPSNLARLGRIGEGAAMLAAAINLPDGSVALLQERFRAEIYNPEGEHATGEREQGQPLPIPEESDRPEEKSAGPNPAQPTETGPRIPEQYAAPIISEDFSGAPGSSLLEYGAGLIRNETRYDAEDVEEILGTPYPIQFEQTAEPQVLIVHTHATEAFEKYDSPRYDTRNTWRSTDNRNNMAAVGDAFARVLEENGIGVLHDTTQHDYPSYNGSYERSAETIKGYLERYPSIKVVLDLHRDAMQREEAIVKPVTVIDGKKAAQLMIIAACDDGGMDIPEWRQNLRFATAYQDYMEQYYPGLTRPVYFCYRKYNMDLTTGSLLLEFGSNANTLDEAVYSATLAARSLVHLIGDNIQVQAITRTEEPAGQPAASETEDAEDPAEGGGDSQSADNET